MNDNKFEVLKNKFLKFLQFCINENINYKSEILVDDFVINNLSLLTHAELKDLPPYKSFCAIKSGADETLVKLAEETLPILYNEIKIMLLDKPAPLQIVPEMQSSVECIFTGLEYSGNNDSSWQRGPSAYALATYNI